MTQGFGSLQNTAGAQGRAGGVVTVCDADRVVPAGGAFVTQMLSDDFTPFVQKFRILPQGGLTTASRSRPNQFVLGSFTVPNRMALALGEYRFRPYRFEGLIPGEAVPVEDYRLSLSIGNDVTVQGQNRFGNLRFQIIPALPSVLNPATQGIPSGGTLMTPVVQPSPLSAQYPFAQLPVPPIVAGDPTVNPAQFVTTLAGASLMPQSPEGTLGPSRLPFTYYVPETSALVLTVAIFSPVRIPIAFFEGVISGYLLPINNLKAMMDKVRPCSSQ